MFTGFWSLTLSDVLFCAFCGRLPRVLRQICITIVL